MTPSSFPFLTTVASLGGESDFGGAPSTSLTTSVESTSTTSSCDDTTALALVDFVCLVDRVDLVLVMVLRDLVVRVLLFPTTTAVSNKSSLDSISFVQTETNSGTEYPGTKSSSNSMISDNGSVDSSESYISKDVLSAGRLTVGDEITSGRASIGPIAILAGVSGTSSCTFGASILLTKVGLIKISPSSPVEIFVSVGVSKSC